MVKGDTIMHGTSMNGTSMHESMVETKAGLYYNNGQSFFPRHEGHEQRSINEEILKRVVRVEGTNSPFPNHLKPQEISTRPPLGAPRNGGTTPQALGTRQQHHRNTTPTCGSFDFKDLYKFNEPYTPKSSPLQNMPTWTSVDSTY